MNHEAATETLTRGVQSTPQFGGDSARPPDRRVVHVLGARYQPLTFADVAQGGLQRSRPPSGDFVSDNERKSPLDASAPGASP